MSEERTHRVDRSIHVLQGAVIALGERSLRVSSQPVVAGRDRGCDFPIDDPNVSATHCEFRASSEGLLLRDLGSVNGTYLGGARVREAVIVQPTTIEIGRTCLEIRPLAKEAIELGAESAFGPLVGRAPPMRALFRVLREVAPTELSVLVDGETGCGKELVAQAIHEGSPRAGGPFVVVDCGSIPATLAESILFGHEKGAFTGANERRRGHFQEAHQGTLFLDELGELPVELQPKLLRALAERKVKRVGANVYEPVDVRVVAATRRDLGRSMNAGTFRSDLFFRLAQVRVTLPPLRSRREDLPLLVDAVCRRLGRPERSADVGALIDEFLPRYDWPGNVRELVNVVSIAATLPRGTSILAEMLPVQRRVGLDQDAAVTSEFGQAKRAVVEDFERRYFGDLVRTANGNVSEIARRSGLARHHVRAYLRKHGLIG